MSAEQNRKTAEQLLDSLSAGDISGTLALLTEDATWLVPGRREDNPAAGTYDKRRLEKLSKAMLGQLKDGLKMTIKGIVAEGDKVSVEAESVGHLQNGRTYNQNYHFLIEFRGGKICAVREYLDTQHAYNIWYARTGWTA